MGKLSKKIISRALVEAKDIPKEWVLSNYGAPYYELHLRMSRIQELEYDFVWGADSFASRSDIQLPNPAQILFLDVSLNDLTALEQHQLAPFSQLRCLNASLNRIENFNGVVVLRKLQVLDLSHNQVSRMTLDLSKCQSLVRLDVSVNQIEDLSQMPTLSSLRILNLRCNKLASLSGLQSLVSLEELYVQNNHLTDILSVAGCRRLRTFNASNNQLTSLTGVVHSLKALPKLQNLSLYGNPVEKVPGYHSAVVNNTTVCVLDNVTIRSHTREYYETDDDDDANDMRHHRRHWMVGHDGRHWQPIVDTTRLAFEQQMMQRKRQLDDDLKALRMKEDLLQEEYQDFETKTRRDMDECLQRLRIVAYDDPRPFNYDYFQPEHHHPSRSYHPNHRPNELKPSFMNNSRFEPMTQTKPFYRNVVDTNEVLLNAANELVKLQPSMNERDTQALTSSGEKRHL